MNERTPETSPPAPIRKTRWRFPILLLIFLGATLLAIWNSDIDQRQVRVMATGGVLLFGLALLLFWFFVFSGLPGRIRVLAAGGLGVLALLAFATLELREVSGDLVPIFQWRWTASQLEKPVGETDLEARTSGPDDYPQYLGPDRDARLPHVELARDWSAAAPQEVWRRPIGEGWSGFAVAGDFAITQEQRGDQELVVAYDLHSGEVRWSQATPGRHDDPLGGPGPRATPTIHLGRVYAQGATGVLSCLDQTTGELIWQRDILDDAGTDRPAYGVSASPLVVDDLVVVIAGGQPGRSLIAYDRADGSIRWTAGDDSAAYSSPTLATLHGQRQILAFARNLNSHDAATGERLWHHPWPGGTERTSQPVVLPGNRVFLSSGYGIGGKLFQVSRRPAGDGGDGERWGVDLIWESPRLKAKLTNVVYHDGYLYGLDDGVMVCLDPATGERCWKKGRYGHGQLILAGDLLLVQSEKGEVVLLAARPDEHRELGSFQAISGKSWNTPALAGDLLLLRNAREAACYRLPLAGS